MTEKAHPFELAGMGTGPYRFVGTAEIPSRDMAEKNPSAYNLALQELPRHLVGGCGTCRNCGMAITVICIVRDGQGREYGVGSDCVLKTGDPSLASSAKIAVAKRRREIARIKAADKREKGRLAWLAAISAAPGSITGETNQARLDREKAEKESVESARREKGKGRAVVLSKIATIVADGRGGFCDSIASDLRNGDIPSGRGLSITIDIYAKAHGRSGSKAYNAAELEAEEMFAKAAEITEILR
jgi:hypothetical protein